jgi:hypothetical protein
MPSPFPGMNPYLEQDDVWQDFHDAMIPAIRDVLSPQVSPHFIVKIEEHLYIHEPEAKQRFRVGSADVGLIRPPGNGLAHDDGGVATLAAPAHIVLPQVEMETQTFLEIRDRKDRELITVIELLSPTNKKPGPDREQYLAKRGNVLRSAAHFVEIDLLRGWPKMPGENAPISDYSVMVSLVEERPRAAYWPIALNDPLPPIPIPLRKPVPVARLDLQDVLHFVYDRAYYKDYIYEGSPTPALGPDNLAWARSVIG